MFHNQLTRQLLFGCAFIFFAGFLGALSSWISVRVFPSSDPTSTYEQEIGSSNERGRHLIRSPISFSEVVETVADENGDSSYDWATVSAWEGSWNELFYSLKDGDLGEVPQMPIAVTIGKDFQLQYKRYDYDGDAGIDSNVFTVLDNRAAARSRFSYRDDNLDSYVDTWISSSEGKTSEHRILVDKKWLLVVEWRSSMEAICQSEAIDETLVVRLGPSGWVIQ